MAKEGINSLDGGRLKEIRKALGLKQEEFAESLDISQAALSYLESGDTTMSLSVFKNLVSVFSVNPWGFLGNATNEPLFMAGKKQNLIEKELKNKLVRVKKNSEIIEKALEQIKAQL